MLPPNHTGRRGQSDAVIWILYTKQAIMVSVKLIICCISPNDVRAPYQLALAKFWVSTVAIDSEYLLR